MKHLILFDFDGTLANGKAHLVDALNEFSDLRGLPYPDPETFKAGYVDAKARPLGWGIENGEERFARAVDFFDWIEAETVENSRYMPTLYGGIDTMLESLVSSQDNKVGIVTSRPRASLNIILNHYQIGHHFIAQRTETCAKERGYSIKPAPDKIYCIQDELGGRGVNTVMIGDTCADINMAQNAGAISIGVTWGYHQRIHLAEQNPDYLVESVEELQQTLLELTS